MYNEQHMASQPAFSSFTTKWLVGEIELLHKKLQSLVKKATFHIKENVDIVYFDDMTWRESSKSTLYCHAFFLFIVLCNEETIRTTLMDVLLFNLVCEKYVSYLRWY